MGPPTEDVVLAVLLLSLRSGERLPKLADTISSTSPRDCAVWLSARIGMGTTGEVVEFCGSLRRRKRLAFSRGRARLSM